MRSTYRLLLLLAATLSMSTCDTESVDQTFFVRFLVSNQSSTDVSIRYGSYSLFSYDPTVRVPAGSRKEIAYDEAWLMPPLEPEQSFTCVSVYRESDSLLVFQLAPVNNSQWKFRVSEKYHHEYTLELTDSKLHKNGITNRCGELSGSVSDSLTASPLNAYNVTALEDAPPDAPAYRAMNYNTGHSTTYLLIWYGDVPDGSLRFARQGHRCRTFRVPAEADGLGDRRYELNVALPPLPAPEDSLRWGSCPP